jgi:hypothetical protein
MDLIDRAELTDELANFSDWGSPAVLFFNFADTTRTSVSVDILRYGADLLISRGASSKHFSQFSKRRNNARSRQDSIPFEQCSG